MKELQRNRKNSKPVEVKQIRLGLKIGSNDLDIKLRRVRDFLASGHKVKIVAIFRGREMAHQELGYEMLQKIIEQLNEIAIVEQQPVMAGRNLSILLRSR